MTRKQRNLQPGMGWDGKVFKPQDKQMIVEQLKEQATNGQISFVDSLKLIRDVELNGNIPQPKPKQDRYKEFQSRDKSKPRY